MSEPNISEAKSDEAISRPYIESIISSFPEGSPSWNFYKGLLNVWKELHLARMHQRVPLIGGKLIDLLVIYSFVTEYGGFEVVNGIHGGWKLAALGLEFQPNDARKLKSIYETLLHEY